MNYRIESRLEKIDIYYGAASSSVREEADEIIPWKEIYQLGDDDHFLRFVREHVQSEAARRDQGERSKPVCRCSDSACPVKKGELPPQVVPRRGGIDELDQDAEDRVDAYVTGSHPDVVVGEALDEWISRYADVLRPLTRAVTLLEEDVEGGRGLLGV